MTMMNTPTISKNSYSGVKEISLRAEHLAKRRILITGTIDAEAANNFMDEIMYLSEESREPIDIYINSPGGEINAGLMMYDIMKGIDVPVNVICVGMAASMGALLFAAGPKGHRYMLPHSKTMIHEPLLAGGIGGSATSIKNIADSILATREIVNSILAEHTGRTIEEINEATSYDHYMDAEESVKFGLCDKIITTLKKYK